MKHLFKGQLTTERLNSLLDKTRIRSEAVQGALHDHLVSGMNSSADIMLNQCQSKSFKRALAKLNEVANSEYLKELAK